MSGLGVLHEIGDMGLGFDPLSQEDQQTLKNNDNNKLNQSEDSVADEKKGKN